MESGGQLCSCDLGVGRVGDTYECFRSGRVGDDEVGCVCASSSMWTAMEKRRQKAGSRTTAIVRLRE